MAGMKYVEAVCVLDDEPVTSGRYCGQLDSISGAVCVRVDHYGLYLSCQG